MPVLQSKLNPRSSEFESNREALGASVADLRKTFSIVSQGGTEAAREKHIGRGKLLPRERVRTLLDTGSPFLELSQLAAWDMYDGAVPSAGIITESGTSRTLSAADNGAVIYCTSGSAVTITCAAGLGAGFSCTIVQGGAGKVTVAAGGQTLVSYSGLYSTMGQYAVISAICPVANTFLLAGNLGV